MFKNNLKLNIESKTFKITESGCWEWQRSRAGRGYGTISFHHKNYYLHRAIYRILIGKVSNEMDVLHKCDNPPCFNPNHLFLGTAKDNVEDMIKKGRMNYISMPGIKNGMCKFSNQIVSEIRKDYKSGIQPRYLRAKYKISHAQLWRITSNRTRKEVENE